jgi:hypothetical protein
MPIGGSALKAPEFPPAHPLYRNGYASLRRRELDTWNSVRKHSVFRVQERSVGKPANEYVECSTQITVAECHRTPIVIGAFVLPAAFQEK